MTKTILLLHREELTQLYILLAKYIGEKLNIVHVAYSEKEAILLQANGISDFYVYSKMLSESIEKYPAYNKTDIDAIDKIFIDNTNGRFNLNASIQSDRGFALLNYDQCLTLANAHYHVWKEIFEKQKIDLLLHEPCSLLFNHLGSAMCRAQGGQYAWQVQVRNDKYKFGYMICAYDDYSNLEVERYYKAYKENPEKIDIERCKKFVEDFRGDYSIFFGDVAPSANSIFKLRKKMWRENLSKLLKGNKFNILTQNIEYFLRNQRYFREKVRNAKDYKRYKIEFEELPKGEKYYYYSFHLEPEAVVLYLGDGIYTNQIKLIENIAASLPPEHYLYVKDHPHEYAYRRADDYLRLKQIPNVRLLNQSIPGKQVIKDAIGVFNVNGTAGFEALILGKQVYNVGWSYYCYSNRVKYIKDVRQIRDIVYGELDKEYNDDTDFYAFVAAFLDATHEGYINYFGNTAAKLCTDQEANAKIISEQLIKYANEF